MDTTPGRVPTREADEEDTMQSRMRTRWWVVTGLALVLTLDGIVLSGLAPAVRSALASREAAAAVTATRIATVKLAGIGARAFVAVARPIVRQVLPGVLRDDVRVASLPRLPQRVFVYSAGSGAHTVCVHVVCAGAARAQARARHIAAELRQRGI